MNFNLVQCSLPLLQICIRESLPANPVHPNFANSDFSLRPMQIRPFSSCLIHLSVIDRLEYSSWFQRAERLPINELSKTREGECALVKDWNQNWQNLDGQDLMAKTRRSKSEGVANCIEPNIDWHIINYNI